jgi:hypothetical protein
MWTGIAGTSMKNTAILQGSVSLSILTIGAGRKENVTRGESTKGAVIGREATGKSFE